MCRGLGKTPFTSSCKEDPLNLSATQPPVLKPVVLNAASFDPSSKDGNVTNLNPRDTARTASALLGTIAILS